MYEEEERSQKGTKKVEEDWRGGNAYKEKKREYKNICEGKKKEANLYWEKKVMEAKRKSEIWEIVNKERRVRGWVNVCIEVVE